MKLRPPRFRGVMRRAFLIGAAAQVRSSIVIIDASCGSPPQ
jgi:hypothetical protein